MCQQDHAAAPAHARGVKGATLAQPHPFSPLKHRSIIKHASYYLLVLYDGSTPLIPIQYRVRCNRQRRSKRQATHSEHR